MKTKSGISNLSKTKVIATLGPASAEKDILLELIDSGLDLVRLNCSHSNPAQLKEYIELVRDAEKEAGRSISILADLGGPKIRLAALDSDIPVTTGERITLTSESGYKGNDKIPAGYPELADDLSAGDNILIDDGLVQLKVVSVSKPDILCKVLNDGVLKSHKGINLPGVDISLDSLTEKDLADLDFLLTMPIDFIALSFVRTAEEINRLKSIIKSKNRKDIKTVAKIEKPEAVRNLESIIKESDVIMVARGDLGVEMPTEELPVIQKHIISECNRLETPVITATQMLDSMIEHPRPTRAEASDTANAVFDGSDAVMLSGETSVGKYPVNAVDTMNTIVITAERHITTSRHSLKYNPGTYSSIEKSVCHSAAMLAEEKNAAAIICLTRSGRTALLLSGFRTHVPIVAFTDKIEVARYLNIVWGVRTEMIDKLADTDSTLAAAKQKAKEAGWIKKDDTAVFTAGTPLWKDSPTNTVIIQKID